MTDHPTTMIEHPDRTTAPPAPSIHHPAPQASVWPAVLAAGLTVAFFGLVTWTPAFSVVGIAALLAAVVGWVRELVTDEVEHGGKVVDEDEGKVKEGERVHERA
jgi:hypothetical protein